MSSDLSKIFNYSKKGAKIFVRVKPNPTYRVSDLSSLPMFNKNTKLAEQQRKLVNEHFITRGQADYCSVDATAHYSYD